MAIFGYLLLFAVTQTCMPYDSAGASSSQTSPFQQEREAKVNAAPRVPVWGTLPWGALDFVQYYAALDLIFEGQNPYDRNLSAARQMAYGREFGVQMFAPPWAFLPSLLVIGLSFPLANIGYLTLNAGLLVFCAVCWTLLLFPGRTRYIPFTALAAFLWYPSFLDLEFGQNSLWPLAGFTGWLWFTTRKRHIPAGIFLALTIIKPHLGLLPGVFAGIHTLRQCFVPSLPSGGGGQGKGGWTTIAAFALSFIAATLITIYLRPTIWFEYRAAVQTGTPLSIFRTHTLHGVLYPYAGPPIEYFTYGLWYAVMYFVAVRTWKSFRPNAEFRTPNSAFPASLLPCPLSIWSLVICLLVVPTIPYAWHHDFVFMLPGLVLALGLYLGNKPKGTLGLILWTFMEVWLVLSWFYDHDGFWIVPWMGLAATIWLLRSQLSHRIQGQEDRQKRRM